MCGYLLSLIRQTFTTLIRTHIRLYKLKQEEMRANKRIYKLTGLALQIQFYTHTYIHINLKVQATTNFNSRLTVTLNSYSFIIQKQATNQPPTHKQIHVPNSNSIKMWFLLKLNSGRNLDKMS